MSQKPIPSNIEQSLSIRSFQWSDWNDLWQLRSTQLAERNITLETNPSQPDLSSPYEEDYHRIDQVYLTGRGNFWIAWVDKQPVGHIGAQDIDDHIELRRMYVRDEYRHCGIGTHLLQTLIEHCKSHQIPVIGLWTDEHGTGRSLYRKMGFREIEFAGKVPKFLTNTKNEIRMRLALKDTIASNKV
jgi:GNAT superfamily N-acetyltransferase